MENECAPFRTPVDKQKKMAAQLVRFPRSFRLLASSRQLTVGAVLSAKNGPLEDPVKKLFLDKIKVMTLCIAS